MSSFSGLWNIFCCKVGVVKPCYNQFYYREAFRYNREFPCLGEWPAERRSWGSEEAFHTAASWSLCLVPACPRVQGSVFCSLRHLCEEVGGGWSVRGGEKEMEGREEYWEGKKANLRPRCLQIFGLASGTDPQDISSGQALGSQSCRTVFFTL